MGRLECPRIWDVEVAQGLRSGVGFMQAVVIMFGLGTLEEK